MQQCSICLDDLDGSGPTLACGHRFHASCLARLAGANGTTPTRRGALTACPNCRVVSRVALTPVATFGVGDRVDRPALESGRGSLPAYKWQVGQLQYVPRPRVRRPRRVPRSEEAARGAARRIFKSEYSIAQRSATEISLGICVHYTYAPPRAPPSATAPSRSGLVQATYPRRAALEAADEVRGHTRL